MDFFNGGNIINYGWLRSDALKFLSLYRIVIVGIRLENSVMLLSAVWSLIQTVPIHYRASDVRLKFSKSILRKKQTHLHLG